jgi:hypothetical protein
VPNISEIYCDAATLRQLIAHSRQLRTKSLIPPMASQLFAQASHISAQMLHIGLLNDELLN